MASVNEAIHHVKTVWRTRRENLARETVDASGEGRESLSRLLRTVAKLCVVDMSQVLIPEPLIQGAYQRVGSQVVNRV